ncbi:MAG: OmpA/MotB family protein [Burkholderiaceae bacterium]
MRKLLKCLLWAGPVSSLLVACAAPVTLEDPAVALLAQCEPARDSCQAERDTCLIRLDRLSRNLVEQTSAHTEAIKSRNAVQAELSQCQSSARQMRTETSELARTKKELADRLQSAIAKKDVQIELLKGRLAVRVLDRILFDSGSAAIQPEGLNILGTIAEVLVDGTDRIRVEGHTDDVPISAALRERYPTNWELSGARAASVVRYFQGKYEIDPVRLEAVGHSHYQSVAANDSAENRQRNRRVEVILTAASPAGR